MSTNLADIKVGDRVWVGDYNNPRHRIQPVARLTPKQIILDGYYNGGVKSEYNRYWRGRKSPYGDRLDYSQARRWSSDRITDIATPEECEAYDNEQERERQERDALKWERDMAAAKCDELEALFLPLIVTVVRPHNTKIDGEFSLTLYGSESDVRRWAELLKGDNLSTTAS